MAEFNSHDNNQQLLWSILQIHSGYSWSINTNLRCAFYYWKRACAILYNLKKLFFSFSVCLSVCLSVYLYVCLSVCLSICLPICLCFCPSVCMSLSMSVGLASWLFSSNYVSSLWCLLSVVCCLAICVSVYQIICT